MRRDFHKPPAVEHSVDRLLVGLVAGDASRLRQADSRSLGRLHNFDPRDKEAASIWDTVKDAKPPMIIVEWKFFMGAVGVATLFLVAWA